MARVGNDPQADQEVIPPEQPPVKETNIELVTQVDREAIEFRDDYPTDVLEKRKFIYNCPICLRYFNHMLVSKCCQNYLCIFCIEDMKLQEEKIEAYKATCPFSCGLTPDLKFTLEDVKEGDKIKRYSDS